MGKIMDMERLSSEKSQAEAELAHINAAILLAQSTNAIGCEITIGQICIGISINERVVPVLEAEKEEILKFLRGEANNWE